MADIRRVSTARGSIVGLGDGGSGALMSMEPPISDSSRDIAQTTGGGRRLSTWRVNIVDSVDHRRASIGATQVDIVEEGELDSGGKDVDDTIKEEGHIEEKNPWSRNYSGIPFNYFSVGLVYGGSVNLLFPVLIIENGVDSSFFSAAVSLVTGKYNHNIPCSVEL